MLWETQTQTDFINCEKVMHLPIYYIKMAAVGKSKQCINIDIKIKKQNSMVTVTASLSQCFIV